MHQKTKDLAATTCGLLLLHLQCHVVCCHGDISAKRQTTGSHMPSHENETGGHNATVKGIRSLDGIKYNGWQDNTGQDYSLKTYSTKNQDSIEEGIAKSTFRSREFVKSRPRRRFKRRDVETTTVAPSPSKQTSGGPDSNHSHISLKETHLFVTVNLSTLTTSSLGRTKGPYGMEYSERDIEDTSRSHSDKRVLRRTHPDAHTVHTVPPVIDRSISSKLSDVGSIGHQGAIANLTESDNAQVLATTVVDDLDPKYDVGELQQKRNVSSLLDFLMNGYDKRLRPGFGGSPVIVKTDIVIRSMGPISEKDMIYSMDCYFRQKWTDHRLSFNASQEQVDNVTLNVKMLDWIWKPDTIFINGGHSYIHTITTPNMFFRLSHDGSILYSQRLTIKANCPMHLEKFPMDTQQCPLHIGSFGYSSQDVHYEWHHGNEKAAIAADDMRMSQFDLKGMPASNTTRHHKGTLHSVLTVFFDFRRHTGYFLIQVYLPCCLLVVLSWVSFWINREATSERISLGAMTVLTLTLIVLDTRNDLPRVNYPTALDIYVAMCFGFIFASIVQFAAVHFYTKYGTSDEDMMPFLDSEDEEDEEDDPAYVIPNPSDLDRNRSTNNNSMTACLKKMWLCIKSTQTTKRRFQKNVRSSLGLNSVSKIDKVSRIIFPAAFSGFNIVYWMSYL